MANTRAKFLAHSVVNDASGNHVELLPVVDGSDENKSFFDATPAGKIELHVVNPDVVFEAGKQYYVDFTLADDESVSTPAVDAAPAPVDDTVTAPETADVAETSETVSTDTPTDEPVTAAEQEN